MPRILLGLSFWNLLFLCTAMTLGWTGAIGRDRHMVVGLFTVTFCLLSHSLIFLHFLGTGASVKKAVLDHGLDPEYARKTRRYKLKTFPASMAAMLLTVAAGGVGGGAGGTDSGVTVAASEVWRALHFWLGAAIIPVNIFAHWIELKWVTQNSLMIEEVDTILIERAERAKTAVS